MRDLYLPCPHPPPYWWCQQIRPPQQSRQDFWMTARPSRHSDTDSQGKADPFKDRWTPRLPSTAGIRLLRVTDVQEVWADLESVSGLGRLLVQLLDERISIG